MTDLKEHVAAVRRALKSHPVMSLDAAIASLNAIEAALFPTPSPAPDPAKQFVVGERYRSGHGIDYTCLFVFPDGSMGYMKTTVSGASMPFYHGHWTHVPRNPALEAMKAERDATAARLAELDAKLKEMED